MWVDLTALDKVQYGPAVRSQIGFDGSGSGEGDEILLQLEIEFIGICKLAVAHDIVTADM